ncbi:hypothetical protein LGL08_20435 [Clostridium estertheticum]|nr:hypothetical protein [Clostridium estertheticum]MCB2308850.1 hypothetical protein [Clostridium estertheticum]MCB2347262.1 hypothetical protein [Clostridium estertheticum]MCB2351897.1 hypothetical protein [Clostridium estertheticum]WAG48465.1 hypothetical protein LL127_23370 [Clostridium estertheticum]
MENEILDKLEEEIYSTFKIPSKILNQAEPSSATVIKLQNEFFKKS